MSRGFGTVLGVGGTDKIDCASIASATQLCISAWYNRNGSGGGTYGRIVDKNAGEYNLYYSSSPGPGFSFGRAFSTTAGLWQTTTAASLVTGAWLHILIVYDGSSTTNAPVMYINGALVATTLITAPVGTVTNAINTLSIGNRAANDRNWDGLIGDVAVWNGTLLTAADACALYNGADPRNIRPNYLAEFITNRSGLPRSLKRAGQPVTTGTKLRGDRRLPKRYTRMPWFVEAGGASAITGTTTLTFTTSGTLTGTAAASGTSSLTFSTQGTMGGLGSLAGTGSVAFTPSGTLTAGGALTGATSLTFTLAGSLATPGAITGTTSITFNLTGTLTGTSASPQIGPVTPGSGQIVNTLLGASPQIGPPVQTPLPATI